MKKILVVDEYGKVVKVKYLFKDITTERLKEFTRSLPQYWNAVYVPRKYLKLYYFRHNGLEPYLFMRESPLRSYEE